MSLSSDYRRQFDWRAWPRVFDALPSVRGKTILDLGCGIGDQAAEFVARGGRVIGIDANEELLHAAQSKRLSKAEFRLADLRTPLKLDGSVDGLWSSFAAAYFPDLSAMLTVWANHLRAGGWIALTEIDDLFGHEPLSDSARSLFKAYARDAIDASRYDFHMGRKLRDHVRRSGFTVSNAFTVDDQEFSFGGPAAPGVVDAWRTRLDRMTLLHDFSGRGFEHLRTEFLDCLIRADHRSVAKVYCCIAFR